MASNNDRTDRTPASSSTPGHDVDGESISPDNAPAFVAGELKRAFEDLARGEKTASMLEASLTALESKLDAILANIDAADAGNSEQGDNGSAPSTTSTNEERSN